MQRFRLFSLLILATFLSAVVLSGCASNGEKNNQKVKVEKDYPTKSITYMIPFDPGGQSDVAARRQEPHLEDILGVDVNIEYRAGGGGSVGWSELVRQEPDGYYIGGINIPHIILQPIARENAGYKTSQIEPVALVQATPIGLAVPKDSKFDTLEEFVNFAKENPGAITVGGCGTYTGHHITTLLFEDKTGADVTYVPFTGAAPQISAFLGGHVSAVFANSNDLVKHKDSMKILAIGTNERFPQLSDVPTFKEQGIDMVPGIVRGVGVPPGTPEAYKKKLEDAFLKIVNKSEVTKAMTQDGFEVKRMGIEESEKFINQKKEKYKKLLEEVK